MPHLFAPFKITCTFFVMCMLLIGCTPTSKLAEDKNSYQPSSIQIEGIGEINEIVYRSSGPMVNPKYSKTFTIRLQLDSMRLTLDSLKTMAFDKDRPLLKEEVDYLEKRFKAYNIKKIPVEQLGSGNGCIGGEGEELSLKMDEELRLTGYSYRCSGESYGDLSGDITGLFIDLEKMAYQE